MSIGLLLVNCTKTIDCDAFDFSLEESKWIILPQGKDYTFSGEGKTINFVSNYDVTESYTIENEVKLIPLPPGNDECFSRFNSTHESRDGKTQINFSIRVFNNGDYVAMNLGFDDMYFGMEIENDTIIVDGNSFSGENSEPLLFQNFSSLSLANRNFQNVVTISNQITGSQPQKIYIAKDFGLFAYQKNDTLWLRN